MKRLLTCAASCMAALLVFAAHTGVSPYSILVYYEPDIPESLKQ